MLQGKMCHAGIKHHVAIDAIYIRIVKGYSKVPFFIKVLRLSPYRLGYSQAAICVPGIGEHRRGGRIGFDVAADGAAWRGDIAVLIRFCLGHGVGNPRGQAPGGLSVAMLQGERRHAACEAHVAVGTADARIAEHDGKVPFLVGFARVPGDRLGYS